MRPRQHAHERRLAGAIAANQPHHLTCAEIDAHVVDGAHAAEGDVDPAHLYERGISRGHVDRRRKKVYRPTAATSTVPTTMSWVGESTRSMTMPERSDCITTAPSTAPGIVPMPPDSELPPMTAAAITSSSFWTPRFVTAALRRAVCTAALIAHSRPIRTYARTIVRRTFMPASYAAAGLPPMANT